VSAPGAHRPAEGPPCLFRAVRPLGADSDRGPPFVPALVYPAVCWAYSKAVNYKTSRIRSWRNEGSKMLAGRCRSMHVPARLTNQQAPRPNAKSMHDAENDEEVDVRRNYPPHP